MIWFLLTKHLVIIQKWTIFLKYLECITPDEEENQANHNMSYGITVVESEAESLSVLNMGNVTKVVNVRSVL
jgi:hypothetical protein